MRGASRRTKELAEELEKMKKSLRSTMDDEDDGVAVMDLASRNKKSLAPQQQQQKESTSM